VVEAFACPSHSCTLAMPASWESALVAVVVQTNAHIALQPLAEIAETSSFGFVIIVFGVSKNELNLCN
jgi:hypothetical protein